MNFTNSIDTLTGQNQFGLGRKNGNELSPGSRSKHLFSNPIQPLPTKRTGLLGEDEDLEPNLYMNMYRPDKELYGTVSPSQMASAYGTNLYGQANTLPGNSLPNLSQRGFPPVSMQYSAPSTVFNQNFPIGMQLQSSPNRSMTSAIGQRGIISQSQVNPALFNLQKRTPVSNVLGSGPLNSSMQFGFPRANDLSHPQSGFDLSDFPTLGSRSTSSYPIPSQRSYVGMVNKPVTDSAPEFQIQEEEFPALPGAQNPSSAPGSESKKSPGISTLTGSYEQAVSKETNKFGVSENKTGNSVTVPKQHGIQIHSDGTVSNIPSGMVNDQFGIVGLLTFLRAAESDPNLVALAPGIDLTTLGLNLNSPEHLYSTFQSPWADAPCRPQDIDFHVPVEYLTNIYIREKLAAIKLNRYSEDLLFFLFYMYGGDVLQLAAAAELYVRDWRYHKEEKIWIARAPGYEPVMKTASYERGTYYFFDAQSWRKVTKEFHLEYDKLEDRPHLPPTLHQASNPPAPVH